MRAAKVQASLRIRAVSPEPSLLAHTSSESRGTFRQKARSLAPLNGWACAVEVCHDGMLEDTNSLDGAQLTSTRLASNEIKLTKLIFGVKWRDSWRRTSLSDVEMPQENSLRWNFLSWTVTWYARNLHEWIHWWPYPVDNTKIKVNSSVISLQIMTKHFIKRRSISIFMKMSEWSPNVNKKKRRWMSRRMTKPTKLPVRPAKTRINLGIRPVWSESLLSAWRNLRH